VLTAKKKIAVREAMPQSGMSSFWDRTRTMYTLYGRYMLGGLALVVAIVAVWYITSSGKAEDEITASIQLRKVVTLYQQQQYKMAITGDPTRGLAGLKDIADKYSSTPSGSTAAVYLGNCYLNTDQYDKAIEAFDAASPADDLTKSNVVAGKAAAFEGKKLFAEAAEMWEKAAKMFSNDLLSAGRFLNAGRTYALAGNKEKALAALEKVSEAKTPRYENDVKRLIAQFELEKAE
jgi:tetratricopeptide (TPR) repeat protein